MVLLKTISPAILVVIELNTNENNLSIVIYLLYTTELKLFKRKVEAILIQQYKEK